MRYLVTGATGFVGAEIVRQIHARNEIEVVAGVRHSRLKVALPDGTAILELGDVSDDSTTLPDLSGFDAIIHCAGRAHVMRETVSDALLAFRKVNVIGTKRLAAKAAAEGVRRFVFLSSVKVNGEATQPGRPFTELDPPDPRDPYGVSKLEAEEALSETAKSTGIEVCVIRPPLVYGPGVKANFLRLFQEVSKGLPLPLGDIENRRSLIFAGNLADFVIETAAHPNAAGETFLVSDGDDTSTTELVQMIGHALGRVPMLVTLPRWVVRMGAGVLGKRDMAQRLYGSLQVDTSKARNLLEWSPPFSMHEGLSQMAAWYRKTI